MITQYMTHFFVGLFLFIGIMTYIEIKKPMDRFFRVLLASAYKSNPKLTRKFIKRRK